MTKVTLTPTQNTLHLNSDNLAFCPKCKTPSISDVDMSDGMRSCLECPHEFRNGVPRYITTMMLHDYNSYKADFHKWYTDKFSKGERSNDK